MRISDWSSDVCSSDLPHLEDIHRREHRMIRSGPLKIKLQLFCGDEIAMGPGKADLLEAISAQGSISAAGRALGMSYRRTWLFVDVMNRCFRAPLVEIGRASCRARVCQYV